jgi:uncharacterized protein (DUF934 family)
MSEKPRIWTRKGFIEDRYGEASGAAFFTPEEATGKIGAGSANVLMLEAGDEIGGVKSRLDEIDAVFIRFAVFSDGRGFSMARRLRDRHHFKGEIRATGHVILDQIPLALRVGFDSIAVTNPAILARLEKGNVPELPLYLQPADGAEASAGGRAWARRRVEAPAT